MLAHRKNYVIKWLRYIVFGVRSGKLKSDRKYFLVFARQINAFRVACLTEPCSKHWTLPQNMAAPKPASASSVPDD